MALNTSGQLVASFVDESTISDVEFSFLKNVYVQTFTGEPFQLTSTIGVLRVRDGQITHWRDYPNFLGGAEAAGALPRLAEMLAE